MISQCTKNWLICSCSPGCPANEINSEGNTPQKLAKSLGFKDCMKELKKLTTFQDKILKGGKPKGFAEKWCVQVGKYFHLFHICT